MSLLMELRLTADVHAPRVARQRISEVFQGCGSVMRERAELLISELVTNAVRHGPSIGQIDVRVFELEDTYEIEVADVGSGFDPMSLPTSDGYGLSIIKTLSQEWGVVDNEREFRVWCRVARSDCSDTSTS